MTIVLRRCAAWFAFTLAVLCFAVAAAVAAIPAGAGFAVFLLADELDP